MDEHESQRGPAMRTSMFLFVRREDGYQLVTGGMAVIIKPEDGIYLTVTCEDEINPPAAILTPDKMVKWLQQLHASECSMSAMDGCGKPLNVNPDDRRKKLVGKLEHEETYGREGIDFRIIVVRAEGALWGHWECPECGETGASSKRCSSVESAVEAAITNIGPHPAIKHGK